MRYQRANQKPKSSAHFHVVSYCIFVLHVSMAQGRPIPASTRHWTNVESMLARRLRRRPNIDSTLAQCIVFAGNTILTWREAGDTAADTRVSLAPAPFSPDPGLWCRERGTPRSWHLPPAKPWEWSRRGAPSRSTRGTGPRRWPWSSHLYGPPPDRRARGRKARCWPSWKSVPFSVWRPRCSSPRLWTVASAWCSAPPSPAVSRSRDRKRSSSTSADTWVSSGYPVWCLRIYRARRLSLCGSIPSACSGRTCPDGTWPGDRRPSWWRHLWRVLTSCVTTVWTPWWIWRSRPIFSSRPPRSSRERRTLAPTGSVFPGPPSHCRWGWRAPRWGPLGVSSPGALCPGAWCGQRKA